jgi:hypothetical protein
MAIEDFKKGKDPYEKLGIGIKERIEKWLEDHNIHNTTVDFEIVNDKKAYFIDVDGDVWLESYNLDDVAKIPNYIKFRNVTGKFILANRK